MTGKRIEDLSTGVAVTATDLFPSAQLGASPAKSVSALQIKTYINTANININVLAGGNTQAATLVIGTNDNNTLAFETNGTTKLTITSSGDLALSTVFTVAYATGNTVIGGTITSPSVVAAADYTLLTSGTAGTITSVAPFVANSSIKTFRLNGAATIGAGFQLDMTAATPGIISSVYTSGVQRFLVITDGIAESGSSAGTNVVFAVYDDALVARYSMYIRRSTGNISINNSTTLPTAKLDIGAGTATAGTAPIKLTTGAAMTAIEDGALEYHTSHLYFSIGATRYQLDQQNAAIGGTIASGTTGSILFVGAGPVLAQDNANLFWDDTSNYLGIGTAIPAVPLAFKNATGQKIRLYTTVNPDDTYGFGVQASELRIATTSDVAGGKITFYRGYSGTLDMSIVNGQLGIGVSAPTAYLHLIGGTNTIGTAPMKFTSGSLLTIAEAGAVEFLTDKAYITISTGAARKEIALAENALTSGRVVFATTNGRLFDDADFTFSGDTLTITKIAATEFTGDVTITDHNFILGTTTGTKFGTSTSHKLAFYNSTPIVQTTTAVATSAFVANTSGIVDDSATFGGYKISQVVKALQLLGLLA